MAVQPFVERIPSFVKKAVSIDGMAPTVKQAQELFFAAASVVALRFRLNIF